MKRSRQPGWRLFSFRRVILLLLAAFVLVPLSLLLLGRFVPIAVTSYMLQSPVKPVQHQWVPRERIADTARRAVVAAEDQKFWSHSGFDVEAMRSAYERNQRGGRVRGGSTISQQTAKNLFLWPGGGYARKGVEAGVTVLIEALWGKERILEVYLNSAEFGPGIYGVEAAAQKFFGKPAAQLSASDAARLAAVLPSPRKWRVGSPGPYVQSRAAWIQRQMGYSGRPAPREDAEPTPPPGERPDDDEQAGRFDAEAEMLAVLVPRNGTSTRPAEPKPDEAPPEAPDPDPNPIPWDDPLMQPTVDPPAPEPPEEPPADLPPDPAPLDP